MNLKQAKHYTDNVDAGIEEYILERIDAEPTWAAQTYRDTHLHMINPRMASGHLQGRILSMLSKMIRPERILEIGTFSGYSALCLAEGLTEGGALDTIEIDDELEDFIRAQFLRSPFKDQINLIIGDGRAIIPQLQHSYDMVFIDADKRLYQDYLELVLPKVRQGGYILADNTLWDGKVLIETPQSNDYQTIAIKAFNDALAADTRLEKVIRPLRDGLTLIRKK